MREQEPRSALSWGGWAGISGIVGILALVVSIAAWQVPAGSGGRSEATATSGALTPAPTATPPPPTAPPATPLTVTAPHTDDSGSKPVWRTGSLTFKSRTDPTDLDAPPSDRQWGRVPGIGSGVYELDDVYDGGLTFTSQTPHALIGQPGGPDTCSTTTAYESGGTQELARLGRGRTLCVQTDEGRIAAMVVTAVSQDAVTFDVTVWDS